MGLEPGNRAARTVQRPSPDLESENPDVVRRYVRI